MPSVRIETVIAAPAADCFGLSLSVDAHTASMGPSGEQAVAGVTSGELGRATPSRGGPATSASRSG